jgi:hypothetical protein
MKLFLKKYFSEHCGRKIALIIAMTFLELAPLAYSLQSAHAAGLTGVSNQVTDSRPGISAVNYITKWTFPGTTAIGCMQIQFADDTSTPTLPTGMHTNAATKVSITGGGLTTGNWTLTNTTDGTLKYTHTTSNEVTSTGTPVIITTGNITNPTSAGVIYAIINTYTGNNCSTGPTDTATIAFSIISGQLLSVTVDPSLSFSVTGVASSQTINGVTTTATSTSSTIPLDNVNPTHNAIAAQKLTVSTNATNGYTVYASYSGTLRDGSSHTIADWTDPNSLPTAGFTTGSSHFGYSTDDTNLSRFQTDKWAKFETWGYEVAKNSGKVDTDENNILYQVGVGATQEAGLYTTTIILTATPSY